MFGVRWELKMSPFLDLSGGCRSFKKRSSFWSSYQVLDKNESLW